MAVVQSVSSAELVRTATKRIRDTLELTAREVRANDRTVFTGNSCYLTSKAICMPDTAKRSRFCKQNKKRRKLTLENILV